MKLVFLCRALTRPGRFDSTVTLTYPDVRGRWKILKVHAKKLQLNDRKRGSFSTSTQVT